MTESNIRTIYTHDWFSWAIPNWEIYLDRFKKKENLTFLELGCYEGMATRWLLDNILTNNNCGIVVVDTFLGGIEHQNNDNSKIYSNFLNNAGSDKRVKIFSTTTKLFLKTNQEKYDFIYIDGSHEAKDVMVDAILGWDNLKDNGIMLFDDYRWDVVPFTSKLHPKMAIDCFLKMYEGEYKIIDDSYQMCLVKTTETI